MLRIACCLAIVASLLTDRARAQPAPSPSPTSEADRLFEEGRALAKQGKFKEACDLFQQSYDLDHATGTELNLADCHEQQGHLREAWRLFMAAAAEFEHAGNVARMKFARDRADAVAAKLAIVVVEVPQPAPPGLQITIAGRPALPGAEVRERVEPGSIDIAANAPGRAPFATRTQAAAGATVTVKLPELAVVDEPAPRQTARRHSRVVVAWSLGGASAAGAITAGGLTLVARSRYNDAANGSHCMHVPGGVACDSTGDRLIRDAQHLADAGTGLAIAGGALALAAAVVYITAPRDAITVRPTASAQSVGLSVSGRF